MRLSMSHGRAGRSTAKWLVTAAVAALLAGCSNSIERFSAGYDNPSDTDPVYTASVQKKQPVAARPYKRPAYQAPTPVNEDVISEAPLAKAPMPAKQPSYSYVQSAKKTYKAPILKQSSYEEPIYEEQPVAISRPRQKLSQLPPPEEDVAVVDESVSEPVAKKPPFGYAESYKPKAGMVRVGYGVTLYSIAKANGVSVQQMADANDLEEPYHVKEGQLLKVPGKYKPAARVAKAAPDNQGTEEIADAEPAPAKKRKSGATHTVGNGETLYSLGRTYGVSPFAIADANDLSRDSALKLGQKIRIPGATKVVAEATEEQVEPVEVTVETTPEKVKKPNKKAVLALTEEQDEQISGGTDDVAETVPVKKPKAEPKVEEQVAQAPATNTGLSLRWPVKGKIISNFGPKSNGLKNEGINIAVPEGTAVRAAEGGVVAYAGSELKGYGNLVLIRHEGGFVTAYAHAKELMVKRGDTVKRGDIIAKAGQTGAVSSPQLHFEVRKGATALDPSKHLSSAAAMN